MTAPKVTLTQLYYLVAIDNYGNFKKAAEACNKSQPSLTNAIKDLTDVLGAGTLVDTSVIPLNFTPAGNRVVAKARDILADAADLERIAKGKPARKRAGGEILKSLEDITKTVEKIKKSL